MNTGRKALATIALGVDSKGLPKDLAKAKKQLRSFGADTKKFFKGIGGKVSGGMLFGGAAGSGAAMAGGIASVIGDSVSEVLDFEKGLTRFQIASSKSAAELDAMRKAITSVSRDTAISRDQVLAGAQTYVDLTGDVAGAERAMSSFARISQASGASVSDVATATAALQQSMGLKSGDIEAVFSGLISQGKMGAVSLKDFAGELSALAPKFAKFGGGTGPAAIANLGAAFQAARQGFGSASEAATGLEALMGALTINAGKFKKANVKIFNVGKDGKKTFRGFNEIIDSIGKSKLAKDPTLLAKAFGSKEALQAYDMLVRNKDLLGELAVAGRDAGAVQRDLMTFQESAAGKIEKAMNAAKLSLAEAFTPERIEKFAAALGTAADYFAKIVGYMEWINNHLPQATDFAALNVGAVRGTVERRGLKGEERKAEIGRLATRLATGQLKGVDGTTPEQALAAARELAKEAGILLPQDDAWNSASRPQSGPVGPMDPKALEEAVVRGMARAKVFLEASGNALAKTTDNATSHRKGGRR